jgi:hypothetical protein
MIFEEREYKAEKNFSLLTWDKVDASFLGEFSDLDIKSFKLEIEAGDYAIVVVEFYDKDNFPQTFKERFSVSLGDFEKERNFITIPMCRLLKEFFNQYSSNQLFFDFFDEIKSK